MMMMLVCTVNVSDHEDHNGKDDSHVHQRVFVTCKITPKVIATTTGGREDLLAIANS